MFSYKLLLLLILYVSVNCRLLPKLFPVVTVNVLGEYFSYKLKYY